MTEADRAVEEALRARLASARPDDGVIGEEFGAAAGSIAGRNWIIDPIDGTKGYVRGIPVWSTLLALAVDGEITVGVASAPELDRRWWASRGEGAWLDDGLPGAPRRLRVSSVRELSDAQASFGDLDDWRDPGRLETLLELSRRCWRTGGYGDVFTYMLVAEGAVDIGVYPEVKLWDLAAAKVDRRGGRRAVHGLLGGCTGRWRQRARDQRAGPRRGARSSRLALISALVSSFAMHRTLAR